ncbi:MAG TPA: ChbG/HpnK family deacetylase [Chloroflexi bacterium]|nr:ChbG/HpnK family deacetylase [Chloroflexota bacterium]
MKNNAKAIMGLMAAASIGFVAGRYFTPKRKRERITGPRYLIINADDFGMSDGVTEGIIRAWQDGVVTSTSAMINIKGAVKRVKAARKAHPDLPIGLHLNTTTGCPALPPEQIPTLVDDNGYFHDRYTVFRHLLSISLDELRAELHAQAKLLLSTGAHFDHIDYHHHLMVIHSPFYPLVSEMALEYGVPVRQPVPERFYGQIKVRGNSGGGTVMQNVVKFAAEDPIAVTRMVSVVMAGTYKKQAAYLQAEGVKTTNWLVNALYNKPSVENFVSMLRQLPPGVSELIAHPAVVDDQLRELGGNYVEQRASELEMLTDPRVKEAMEEYLITPVDFSFVKRL